MGFLLIRLEYLGEQNPKCGTHIMVCRFGGQYMDSERCLKFKLYSKRFVLPGFVHHNALAVLKALQV